MREEIIANQNDPRVLEQMYRINKAGFKKEFTSLYPELKGNSLADFWNERLNYEKEEISWGTSKELLFVVIASLIAGFIAKFPAIFAIDEEFFYPRNIGFIVFPALALYFAWRNKLSTGKVAAIIGLMLIGLIYINSLPGKETDTLILSCIHLALCLWSVLGFAYVGETSNNEARRLGFLKYNGDLVVICALIGISGLLMSGITVGLFSLIGFNIEKFYFQNIAVFGLAAIPIVGTFLTQTNPQLVGKVSPVIAKIFSPLVLVMLVIYLVAMIYSGKDPYNDREFLMIFNALLIGVMAIIFFSVAETSKSGKSQAEVWILLLLSIVTIIVNGVALSAIVFRISEMGFTPNRTAVLGANVLILINLLLVSTQLFAVISKKKDINGVGKVIASYLPVYLVWSVIVTFVFPLIFGFR
ncbi:hypothetical protein [Daejeonella lutea]|uniref:DUF4153 domain-containing protein n=1 Tax=Daejeonella lutea TaxID=572036 RepID=A0A1T5ET01_9SPHI|nr:hypothetical protein [Daejeonella lutea]SKB87085.1 hypothetical protein SAMN05661099_3191 [Daejeonella lutea]